MPDPTGLDDANPSINAAWSLAEVLDVEYLTALWILEGVK